MTDWTHAICFSCWNERKKDQQPHMVINAELEACCFCGKDTQEGIYIRHDGSLLPNCIGHEDG